MKKRVTSKHKTKHTTQRTKKHIKSLSSYTGLLIVGSSIAILLVIFLVLNKRSVAQSVAGTSLTRGFYEEAIIPLPHVDGANFFNIYYKRATDSTFTNAVSNIPASSTSYTISYLRKGTPYQYEISALGTGSEFWFSNISSITNLQPM